MLTSTALYTVGCFEKIIYLDINVCFDHDYRDDKEMTPSHTLCEI